MSFLFLLISYVISFIQISLAELQTLISELEGRTEGQAANIESLTATLKTKDEIINVRILSFTDSDAAALNKELLIF